VVTATLGVAPATARAQGWREAQLWAVALGSRPAVFAGGLGGSIRDARRNRLLLAAAAGANDDGDMVGRGELAYHFLLDPASRGSSKLYAGGGLALSVTGGDVRPLALLVVGAEHAPGGSHGAFIEFGVGGGARLAIGMRWRRRFTGGV
jgi:hypothetical protein